MASDLLFVVAEKLAAALLQSKLSNLSTAYSGMKSMESELRRIHELLEEDPGLEINEGKSREWMRDLKETAQNIEDFSDDFLYNVKRRQQRTGCMSNPFILTLMGLMARYRIEGEIKQLKQKMDHCCEWMPKKKVVGFDTNLNELVKWLVEGDYPNRRFWCIAGQDGAGRTTLAKEVYYSADVRTHFGHRVWVSAATYKFFSLKKITKKVTGCSQEELMEMNKEAMCKKISDALKGRRYLIVLDINLKDYLFTKAIDEMKEAFPDETNGSRVLLTSNHIEDAHQLEPEIEVHELQSLTPDDRWQLFLNTFSYYEAPAASKASTSSAAASKAITSSSSTIPMNELEEFVRRYWILPSEIVTLAALLSMEYTRFNAQDRLYSYLKERGHQRTLPEIAFKFNRLEHPLKLCFLYCSLFPQGFGIRKSRLLQLLLAEGWRPETDNEDAAEEYLEKLESLEMITVQEEGLLSSVKEIRLDSHMQDFADMEAKQYNQHNLVRNINDEEESPDYSIVRRLAVSTGGLSNLFSKNTSLPKLRSLLCFPIIGTEIAQGEVSFPASRFKLLRALDLEDMHFITQLPEETGELIHLRYLGLRCTGLESLPSSIGNLVNLQILDIRGTRVRSLPSSIGNLVNLRSLDIRGTRVKPTAATLQKFRKLQYLYMEMADEMDDDSMDVSSLNSLVVLSTVRVGEWMEGGLQKLTNLRKLGIHGGLDQGKHAEDLRKLRLKSLRLGFGFGDGVLNSELEDFLDSLHDDIYYTLKSLRLDGPVRKLPQPFLFPQALTKLRLKWSFLEQDPMEILERLLLLRVLKLRCGSFLGKKMVCSAGGFPFLHFLELNLLGGLEELGVEKGAMPKLQRLAIRVCTRLENLPEGLQHLHQLQTLEVAGMPDPFNSRLQPKVGDDWPNIKHVASVTVDGNAILMGASSSSTMP